MKLISYKSTCKNNRKKDKEGEFKKESSYCRTIDIHMSVSEKDRIDSSVQFSYNSSVSYIL